MSLFLKNAKQQVYMIYDRKTNEPVKMLSGKSSWKRTGDAKNALHNHIDRIKISSRRYSETQIEKFIKDGYIVYTENYAEFMYNDEKHTVKLEGIYDTFLINYLLDNVLELKQIMNYGD